MIAAGLILTAGIGIIVGVVLFAVGLVRGLGTRPDLIEPSTYRDERQEASPARAGEFRPDKAWPVYPFRQARADLAKVWTEIGVCQQAMWKWPAGSFYSDRNGSPAVWWMLFPIPVVVTVCLLAAGLAAAVCWGLFALVSLGCLAATLAVFGPIAAIARGAELGHRVILRTQASCPRCFHVTPWPAYRCPGCALLHRDVRPGRLGLIMRRCECGTMLPTTTMRAAWRLKAACQKCRKPLPLGAGSVRDVRISVFGDPATGKTRWVHAALSSLIATSERAGIAFGFPDQSSKEQVELGIGRLRPGQETARTPGILPSALTFRLGAGHRSCLTHLFDVAGEHFRDSQMHDSLGFLDHSQGLVYVIDPFSIAAVRRQLGGRSGRRSFPATADPEAAYGEVVERLRDSGVAGGGQRLAVIISKADLLRAAGLGLPGDSGLIADWLMESGAHNLVLSARREFAEARFFAVSSQADAEDGEPDDPGAPLRWLLRSHGVRLPAETGSGRRFDTEFAETAGARP
jgi:Double-GTPase 2